MTDRYDIRQTMLDHLRYVEMGLCEDGLMAKHAREWLELDSLMYFTFYASA